MAPVSVAARISRISLQEKVVEITSIGGGSHLFPVEDDALFSSGRDDALQRNSPHEEGGHVDYPQAGHDVSLRLEV